SAYYFIEGDTLDLHRDRCPEGYPLRPHVVWFGESVPMYDDAIDQIRQADVLIVIGTSLNVYPAAGLIHYAAEHAQKFLIDPKSNELQVPSGFTLIPLGAVAGMQQLVQSL